MTRQDIPDPLGEAFDHAVGRADTDGILMVEAFFDGTTERLTDAGGGWPSRSLSSDALDANWACCNKAQGGQEPGF